MDPTIRSILSGLSRIRAREVAILGLLSFLVGLISSLLAESVLLSIVLTLLSGLVLFLSLFRSRHPRLAVPPDDMLTVRFGTAFPSSTGFVAISIFRVILSRAYVSGLDMAVYLLLLGCLLLVGTMLLWFVFGRRAGPLDYADRIGIVQYRRYRAKSLTAWTFLFVLACGADIVVGALCYAISLFLLLKESRRTNRSPILDLDRFTDRVVSVFQRSASQNPGSLIYLGLAGLFLLPPTAMTNFRLSSSDMVLLGILLVPPLLAALASLRLSLRTFMIAAMPPVVAAAVANVRLHHGAFAPAVTIGAIPGAGFSLFTSEQLSTSFLIAFYTTMTISLALFSRFEDRLWADIYDLRRVDWAGGEFIAGAVGSGFLAALIYCAIFPPNQEQQGLITFLTLSYEFPTLFVAALIVTSEMLTAGDRYDLIVAASALICSPQPIGALWVLAYPVEGRRHFYVLLIFQEQLLFVKAGTQDFLVERTAPLAMKKRGALDEVKLEVVRNRSHRERQRCPIPTDELLELDASNRSIPCGDIVKVKIAGRSSNQFSEFAGSLEITTKSKTMSFDLCPPQDIGEIVRLFVQMDRGKIELVSVQQVAERRRDSPQPQLVER